MMQDDTNKIDDDFEDLDFEDLDADDDLDDESWDDFDDDVEGDLTDSAPNDAEDGGAPEMNAAPKKKSFLQKNFNLIVIAIAVLGGGSFVLSQFGGAPATAPSAPTPQAPQDNAALTE
ncbi:MAG: hypothetical protein AAF204_04840, partial [Pseudomonadota bacterium]